MEIIYKQRRMIAGMGGSEILSILSDKKYGFIPKRFVLQPMHDAEKLRRYLVENGADIQRDFTFFYGKFYDVIVGEYDCDKKKECAYTDAEFEFGKDNLRERGEAFLLRIQKLLKDTEKYLTRENLQEESRAQLLKRKERLQDELSAVHKDLKKLRDLTSGGMRELEEKQEESESRCSDSGG